MKVNTVCIVDDDRVYQLTTGKTIEKLNIVEKILSFYDGEQAYNYLSEHISDPEMLPDIILLDINMPFMDAWQFLESYGKIKNLLRKSIIIYVISSSISDQDIQKAKGDNNVKDYLIKPIGINTYAQILSYDAVS